MIKKYLKRFLIRLPLAYELLLRVANKPFDELYLARKLIRNGNIVFDIGANVGQFTILFSVLVGKHGVVHAFEPVNATYHKLIQNIKSWRLKGNIMASQVALSDRNSEGMIYTPIGDLTQSSLIQHSDSSSWVQGLIKEQINDQKVKLMTIDRYMEENLLKRVDYIKCDVEGSEYAVIRGATKLLSSNYRPIILLEYFPAWARDFGYGAEDLFSYLNSVGSYSVFHIQGKMLKRITDFSAEMPGVFPNSLNYLCLPPQIDLDLLRSLGLKE